MSPIEPKRRHHISRLRRGLAWLPGIALGVERIVHPTDPHPNARTQGLVAPFLPRFIPALRPQFFVRDVDHRMAPHDPEPPTNADGIRSRRERADFPPSAFNLLLLGDSYVYGYLLSIEESIPILVEQRLRALRPLRPVPDRAGAVAGAGHGQLPGLPRLDAGRDPAEIRR